MLPQDEHGILGTLPHEPADVVEAFERAKSLSDKPAQKEAFEELLADVSDRQLTGGAWKAMLQNNLAVCICRCLESASYIDSEGRTLSRKSVQRLWFG